MNITINRCTSLEELFQAVKNAKPPLYFLNGGTDLMVLAKANLIPESTWFDISDIQALKGIKEEGDNLVIGAGVTHTELAESELVRRHALALAEAASNVGGPQIRNRGTIGGNLANGSPAADTSPALVSLGASAVLLSERGERTVLVEKYALGNRRTVREPDEIIARFIVPIRPGVKGHWKAMSQRKALSISKISMAVSCVLDGDKFSYLRIGLGSVAATVRRAEKAEAILLEGGWNEEVLAQACAALSAEINPISDVRSSAEYRKAMGGVMLGDIMHEMLI